MSQALFQLLIMILPGVFVIKLIKRFTIDRIKYLNGL